MAATFSKKSIGIGFLIFALGYFVGKYLPTGSDDKNPVIVRYNGKPIKENEVDTGAGNTPAYKRQQAMNLIQARVIADLAANERLTSAAFIQKVKTGADTSISEDEVEKFLRERNFKRETLSKAQMDNILANMKEHKREVFFSQYINKILADVKIEWVPD